MHIAGVMVAALPQHMQVVEQNLLQLPGVEVHASNTIGRMVVTVEGQDERDIADMLNQIQTFPGVLTAAMVYHSTDNNEGDTSCN